MSVGLRFSHRRRQFKNERTLAVCVFDQPIEFAYIRCYEYVLSPMLVAEPFELGFFVIAIAEDEDG